MGSSARRYRPTLDEVAAHAGVGLGTASRALSGTGSVAAATRQRVLASANALGYKVNRAARSLASRRTYSIALVIGDAEQRMLREPFFAALAGGAGKALAERGYLLALVASWPGAETDFLSPGHIDGIILTSAHHDSPVVGAALESGVPLVLVGGLAGRDELPSVDVDNVGGAYRATAHLIERGARRIATITGPDQLAVSAARREGWAKALADHGLEPGPVAVGDFDIASGRIAAEEILASEPTVDAIFAASDQMAVGAYQALKAHGRRVGEDVRIVGFDDAPEALIADPPLSTVRQPSAELGAAAARVLLSMLDSDPAEEQPILPTELVVRESS